MDISDLHPLEIKLLTAISPGEEIREDTLGKKSGLSPEHLRSAAGWLAGRGMLESVREERWENVSLTETGLEMAKEGLPEARIIAAVESGRKLVINSLPEDLGMPKEITGPAVGNLRKTKALEIGPGGVLSIGNEKGAALFEAADELLRKLADGRFVRLDFLPEAEASAVSGLARKRGKGRGVFRIDERTLRYFKLTPAGEEARDAVIASGLRGDEISTLTSEMLKTGSWKGKKFRRYNIILDPVRKMPGRLHPYGEFLDRTRDKLVSLGFKEMRGTLVENEFWNMDALFMPQFHSARDIHDVYYVGDPSVGGPVEPGFLEKVAETHETGGGTGSIGWRYRYDRERARNLVLRSQGTAVSARTLASGPDIPGKYFSFARVFRYEQVSMKHAVDFMQVEGIVLGEKINFRTLIGLLKLFAEEIARAKDIKFTPAYFPFTEPSVEMHVNHPSLGWVELGGAGIFRPEVTHPLGVDVPVIAWGLGIDRMAMNAMGIENIRNLFSTDLDFIRKTRLPLEFMAPGLRRDGRR